MAWLAALLVCVLAPAGAAELPADVLELSRIRLKMRQALTTLPNYTCLAVTERSRQTPRDRVPRRIDTVRVEVAHADHRDMLAWPGAVRFEADDPAKLVGSGMFSSGEFFSHLAGIFSQNAVLRFAGASNLLGRKLLRWDYSLAPSLAGEWRVSWAGRTVIAGETGSFWADPETHEVVRIEVESSGLPPNFPIAEVHTTIDYARVRLPDREVLLPQTAHTILTEFTGARSLNFTEFSHCRQYLTNSEIRYGVDTPTDGPPATAASGVREIVIPGELRVTLELAMDVESKAAVGDPIRAVVADDVVQKKRTILPAGAVVTGRVRRMEQDADVPGQYIFGLEFTDVAYPGWHARFFAKLAHATGQRTEPSGVPGVTVLLVDTEPFRLAKGLSMVWVTEDISRR